MNNFYMIIPVYVFYHSLCVFTCVCSAYYVCAENRKVTLGIISLLPLPFMRKGLSLAWSSLICILCKMKINMSSYVHCSFGYTSMMHIFAYFGHICIQVFLSFLYYYIPFTRVFCRLYIYFAYFPTMRLTYLG